MLNNIKKEAEKIKEKVSKKGLIIALAIFALVLLVLSTAFIYYKLYTMSKSLVSLSNNLTSLQGDLSSTTARFSQTFSDLSVALDAQKNNVGDITNLLGSYRQEVGTITNTVDTLQKLSKTDPELLQKYSKVFFLNENYAPARLTAIPKDFSYSDTKTLTILTDVWPRLQQMLSDAKYAGVDLYVLSAFRSFNEQNALKSQYTVTYGAGSANQFSADQGYSEHQLGTTVDFMTTGIGGDLNVFDTTKAFQWLTANAFRYGFTMSYPKDNPFYVYEPWHWRYVGIKLATDLYNSGRHFYDLDQRSIDDYLVYLF